MKRLHRRTNVHLAAYAVLYLVHSLLSLPLLHAQSPEEMLGRLKATYRDDVAIRADFSQQLTSPDGERLPGVEGTIVLLGDRYRVDTDGQTLVTNGETTWIYNRYENQVLVHYYVDDPSTFSLSDFLFAFDTHYEILETNLKYLDGVRHQVLTLRPLAEESFFREVTLWMRDTDSVITRLRVLDMNEAELDFGLEHLEFDPPLAGDPFTFEPPDGVEVIDLRAE
ncbi:MAG: outer membrane lipoprotein carrier protein LolA [Rhodothermales bacterium]|nr:outer membrane lipoprotein carrier protein LolA [Rhodothermales bacterium]